MFSQLLVFLVDGLLLGSVYGIAAMGLTLIWGVMKVINLAHGPIIALGMFGIYFFYTVFNLNPYLTLPLVAVVGLLGGFLMYVIAVHRVIDAPHLSSLLSTFSLNMIIIGTGTAFLTTSQRNIPLDMGTFAAGAVTVPGTKVVAAVLAFAVTGGLYLFLYRTTLGKSIRAVANNRTAAELMGIPSGRVLMISFGLGTMLATVAGGLIATLFPFTILSGGVYQLKSFVIVVLGGLGNPLGALVGGLVLGAMEGIIPMFMQTSWVPVIEFVLFVLILLVRPSGLLGAR